MMQEINLVQGFRGEIRYRLNYDGKDIDISSVTSVLFNFTDRCEQNHYSIRCKQGSFPNEVIIRFVKETSNYGDCYGEFVIRDGENISIFPVVGHIPVNIRKRIHM